MPVLPMRLPPITASPRLTPAIWGSVFAAIVHSANKGHEMSLSGFGKFKVRHNPAGEGRNPATGETIQISASRQPGFTAAKAVKDQLNR